MRKCKGRRLVNIFDQFLQQKHPCWLNLSLNKKLNFFVQVVFIVESKICRPIHDLVSVEILMKSPDIWRSSCQFLEKSCILESSIV